METVAVDLDVSSNCKVSWRNEVSVFVNVLVLSSLKELALHYSRVLLGRLEDGDGVI